MSASSTDQKDKIWNLLAKEPHRVYDAEGLVSSINPAAARDPQKKEQLIKDINADLSALAQEGKISAVDGGSFKARLYLNENRHIEHAFIGGMGNTRYKLNSPIFRANIGVISMFFIRHKAKQSWMVLVRDSTGGTAYCLTQWLKDGSYRVGCNPEGVGEKDYLWIPGRYIEPQHLNLVLKGDEVMVEDCKTLTGSRIDLLTKEGLEAYEKAVAEYRKGIDPKRQWDPVGRGRYIMDQLLKHKRNFEATFFSAAVDSHLLDTPAN